MPKIWITRTQPGANKSADLWKAAGFDPVIAPLIEIAPPQVMPPVPGSESVVVFTSGHGVRAFTALSDRRDFRVVTVGEVTGKLARQYGFQDVLCAGGNSKSVTQMILQKVPPCKIIHCAGKHVRGQIVEDLMQAGFEAERHIYYDQNPVTLLPDIDVSTLTHIGIYSPLAAKTLVGLNPDVSQICAVSLSAAINGDLDGLRFSQRLIAKVPDELSMITALKA